MYRLAYHYRNGKFASALVWARYAEGWFEFHSKPWRRPMFTLPPGWVGT